MSMYRDQLGNECKLKGVPRRIISLVPSQSELLWDLGITPVGITKFCIHPKEMFRTVERVGGTKTLDIDKIRNLRPDLIIGNREENDLYQIGTLQKEFPVWMSDIYNFEDAFSMIRDVAEITGTTEKALPMIESIKSGLEEIAGIFSKQRVIYFIWNKPYMVAARSTFIHSVLEHCGFTNVVSDLERYPEITEQQLQALNPELCFLSSEPYPFTEKHVAEFKKILPSAKVIIVDGEVFSWYGSRLKLLPAYLKTLQSILDIRY